MLSIPWNDSYITINDMNIRYWDVGTSENVIIMIHGLGGTIEQWFANIDFFSKQYRVICFDMPGCGKTDPMINNDYTLESVALFVDNFVTALHIDSFYLLGLSMGGAVCLRYTIDYPHKVKKLILAGSAGLGPKMAFVFRVLTLPFIDLIPGLLTRKQFSYYVKSMVYDPKVITDDILGFYYPLIKAKRTRRSFLKMLKTNCSFFGLRKKVIEGVVNKLSQIHQPLLILWGKQDHHMPIENVSFGMSRIQNVSLTLLNLCSHNPQFEKADEFNSTICEFLS